MSQSITLLFVASFLLLFFVQINLVSVRPYATFTPPSNFSVGTPFVGLCTADGVTPGSVFQYNVSFWLNSADKKANPSQQYSQVARFMIVQSNATFVAQSSSQQAVLGLETAQGPIVGYPKFEVDFSPQSDSSKGKYLCSVKVAEKAEDVSSAIEFRSNIWDTSSSFPQISSTILLVFSLFVWNQVSYL